jgi:hypothetical protein
MGTDYNELRVKATRGAGTPESRAGRRDSGSLLSTLDSQPSRTYSGVQVVRTYDTELAGQFKNRELATWVGASGEERVAERELTRPLAEPPGVPSAD